MLTKTELDEIRMRCEAATPVPWTMAASPERCRATYSTVPLDADGQYVCQSFATYDNTVLVDNGIFIAHARQDVPNLLEHIAEQDVRIERLYAALRQVEPLCRRHKFVTIDDNKYRRAETCMLCFAQFENGKGKHAESCVFAMLEGGDAFGAK